MTQRLDPDDWPRCSCVRETGGRCLLFTCHETGKCAACRRGDCWCHAPDGTYDDNKLQSEWSTE